MGGFSATLGRQAGQIEVTNPEPVWAAGGGQLAVGRNWTGRHWVYSLPPTPACRHNGGSAPSRPGASNDTETRDAGVPRLFDRPRRGGAVEMVFDDPAAGRTKDEIAGNRRAGY